MSVVLLLAGFIAFALYFFPLGVWRRASAAGAPVPLGTLALMRVRRVPASHLAGTYVAASKAGLDVAGPAE